MDALRWLRSGRITRHEADLLLDRSAGDTYPDLADLLATAAAPARPEELAGERAALAAFRREYRPAGRDARSGVGPAEAAAASKAAASKAAARSAARRSRRRGLVVATLAATVAFVGGTAYAAGTGRLPDPVQRHLHEAFAGVPAPDPRDTPSPLPGTVTASATAAPNEAQLTALCRAWQANRADPAAPTLRPDEQRTLGDAAGGANRIQQFCATLAGSPSPGTTTTTKPGNPSPGVPPTTPPGKRDGNGNNGNGNGHGNGNNGNGKGNGNG
jgi:hypothetical protein